MDSEKSQSNNYFLTLEELALRLKVKKSWIYSRTRQTGANSIPRIKIGKYLRFEWDKVQDWLTRNQNEDKR